MSIAARRPFFLRIQAPRISKYGWRKLMLAAGLVSSLLYVASDMVATLRYEGYSYKDQWVSELVATGSPTRELTIALFTPYNLLVVAFGLGVWLAAGPKRAALVTGATLAASAAAGEITMLFFPMDMRGAEETSRGSLHGPWTMVMSLFTVLAIAFGSTLLGRRFRWYSWGTILTLIVLGILTSLSIPRVEANEPTPWAGATERVNIYAQMLWTAVLAVALWRLQGRPEEKARAAQHNSKPDTGVAAVLRT